MTIPSTKQNSTRPKIGISSCLLGNKVRYDGGHKAQKYIKQTLSSCFDFIPVCPEVAIGMSTPRPPIRLVTTQQGQPIRLVDVKDHRIDHTEKMQTFAKKFSRKHVAAMSGFILKNRSPSCGMERVKVYHATTGQPFSTPASGIFAATLLQQHPNLPIEEEGRLNDTDLRENFLMRVYVYHEWQNLFAKGITPARLVDFHSRQKYLLMSHNQQQAKSIGQLVAQAGVGDIQQRATQYITALMQTLRSRVSRKRHTNTLMHLMGYLRENLDKHDRQELLDSIMDYYHGVIPLLVPLTLLKHHFNRHPDPYIQTQTYLSPYPAVLNTEA